MPNALELARFAIEDADEPTLIATRDRALHALAAACPGLVSSQLVRLDDGSWLDAIVWESRAHAVAAAEQAPNIDECARYFGLFAEIIAMEHGELVAGGA